MRALLSALATAWLFNFAQGQSLSIPSTWQHTTLSQTRDERIQIAQAGLDYTFKTRYFNHTNDPANNFTGTFPGFPIYDSANMLWTMALKDRIANTTDNIHVIDAIHGFGGHYPQYQDSPTGYTVLTPVNWGMAAMMAYLTYGRQDMLAVAESTWDYVSQYQITEDQATQGQHPSRNVTFSKTCNSRSVAGAVFTSQEPSSLYADAQLIDNFILLSAHLAEQTGNQTYLDAAKLSANFIFQQLYDSASQLVETDFTIGATDATCQVNLGAKKRPHSSGKYMEALSVLQSRDDDPKWPSMIVNILDGAARHDWPSSGGVMGDAFAFTDDDKQYKGKFFRSLYEVMIRTNQTDVHDLITSFINVQANSILQNATITGTNFYTSNWTGPAETSFTIAGALASLDVLTVAIGPASSQDGKNATTTTGSANSTATSVDGKKSRSNNIGLQVGLGIGIPVWAFLSLLAVWCFIRRRRRRTAYDLQPKSEYSPARSPNNPQSSLAPAHIYDPEPAPVAHRLPQQMESSPRHNVISQVYGSRKLPVPHATQNHASYGGFEEAPPLYEASASNTQRT